MVARGAAVIGALVCRLALGVITALGLLALGPIAVGMTSTVVMSDSMAPGLRSGDVVVVRPVPASAVRPGQVVLVDDPDFPGRLRLHRLVRREGADLVLRGDANAVDDPTAVAPRAVRGVGFLRVPWIGLPVFWLRTGAWPLAVAALAAVALLALGVVRLEGPDGGPPPVLSGLLRRGRRLLASPTGRATLLAVGLAATLASGAAVVSSWSVFTTASPSPSNTLNSTSWICPAVPTASPTPGIYYAFMGSAGQTPAPTPGPSVEPNVGGLGANFNATLSSTSLRTTGTCTAYGSPAIQFPGQTGQVVRGNTSVSAASTGSSTIWFDPAQATGVLTSVGSAAGTDATKSDRQLYFTTSGQLAFAMRDGSNVDECATGTATTLNAWHFAAVTFNSSSKAFTLYYDGSAVSCSPSTITTASSITGYTRIGSDAAIAADAASTPYTGVADAVGAWSQVLSTAYLNGLYAAGD